MYAVPGMQLIPQKNDSSCWYATAWMLINWKRQQKAMTLAAHPDPSQVRQTVAWEVAANGLINPDVLRMARLLGLKSVPPMSPSLEMLEGLLRNFGPLGRMGRATSSPLRASTRLIRRFWSTIHGHLMLARSSGDRFLTGT
jgi:hypothetical protein